MRHPLSFAAAIVLSALLAGPVQAAPLGLTLQDFPDIVSHFITVTYIAGPDSFTATRAPGVGMEIDLDGVSDPIAIDGGSFDIAATISGTGALLGGSLNIGGTVASLGFNSGTLLTGNLTAFGFPDAGGNPLEFLFDVTGGDAAGLYGGVPGGVILGSAGFGGSFDSDWMNSGGGLSDTAPVPLPGAALLLGSGLAGLAALRRRAGGNSA